MSVLVRVHNYGPTQSFSREVLVLGSPEHNKFPLTGKWKGTTDENREIVKGQARLFEVAIVRYTKHNDRPGENRFEIDGVVAVGAHSEVNAINMWYSRGRITGEIQCQLHITAVETGAVNFYNLIVHAATDGHQPPLIMAAVTA
jgi:hypothetical protein